jgi:hypothetical protein
VAAAAVAAVAAAAAAAAVVVAAVVAVVVVAVAVAVAVRRGRHGNRGGVSANAPLFRLAISRYAPGVRASVYNPPVVTRISRRSHSKHGDGVAVAGVGAPKGRELL